MATLQGFSQVQSLVEIDHQIDFLADGIANRLDRRNIISEPLAAEAKLQTAKITLIA